MQTALQELMAMAQEERKSDKPLWEKCTFLGDRRLAVRAIGSRIYIDRGHQGMTEIYNQVRQAAQMLDYPTNIVRELEIAWDGIGIWTMRSGG